MTYVHWDKIAMFAAIAVVAGFEFLGVFSARYITITAIIHEYIPRWLLAMVYGWLGWHFFWRYK